MPRRGMPRPAAAAASPPPTPNQQPDQESRLESETGGASRLRTRPAPRRIPNLAAGDRGTEAAPARPDRGMGDLRVQARMPWGAAAEPGRGFWCDFKWGGRVVVGGGTNERTEEKAELGMELLEGCCCVREGRGWGRRSGVSVSHLAVLWLCPEWSGDRTGETGSCAFSPAGPGACSCSGTSLRPS